MKKQMYYSDMIFSSSGNKILVNKKGSSKSTKYLIITKLGLLNYFNLYNRALRHGIHNFYKINENIDCVIIKEKFLFYNNKKLINILELEKGSRPLRNGVVYRDNYIIYSEYYGNKNREPINVYKYSFLENKKEILYTFNKIRHIHFIQEDIYNPNNIYIGTGDLDEECGIYKFDLANHNIKKLEEGPKFGGLYHFYSLTILYTGEQMLQMG